MKWLPGTGLSAQHYIVSECGRWQICKSGEPPVYTLAEMGGKHPALVMSGTLADCKARAANDH